MCVCWEFEGDGNASVRDGGCMVVVSAWHVDVVKVLCLAHLNC